MNLRSVIKILSLLFFTFSTLNVLCQNTYRAQNESSEIKRILNATEKAYGPDDLLYRGLLYIPDHPKAESHPYFSDENWNNGSVILAGDQFSPVDIKYNVNLQLVILKKNTGESGAHQPIILDNKLLDGFTIDNHLFSNLTRLDTSGNLKGFGEVYYNRELIFYKSFSKEFINRYSQSNPYGFYSKLNASYSIYRDGKISKISNKRALLNYFKPIRKPLKKYIRQEDFQFKNATKQEFYQLLEFCEKQTIPIRN